MKHVRFVAATIFVLALATATEGQELIPPSPGRSMVYFVRSHGSGALVNFKYFDGERCLGKFNVSDHAFWVTSESRDFVEATLLPDKIYVIEVRPIQGLLKPL